MSLKQKLTATVFTSIAEKWVKTNKDLVHDD